MKKSENTPFGRFWERIRFLIEPPPDITDTRQRHQARLLSALLLIVILLGGLSGTVQLLTVPGFFSTFAAILGAIVVLCFAYFLARTKHYLVAAMLAALTPFMASYAALLENTEDQSAFAFMLISVVLSSMLLNRWLTLGVACLNLLGLVLLPVVQPAWTVAIVAGKVSFHVIISALILVAMWQRDVIERDRQRELSESELKFRSIFDHSVDAIGVSRDGVHIMANPAYVRMFGCRSADNLVGRSILDLIAPSERAKIQENIRRRAMGEDVPAMYETRGLRCDGTEFDMEVHVSTYELEGRLYTVPILRDITERKMAEDALRASEEAYKLLFESNPQPMWVYDTSSLAFLAVNDEAVSKYGYSRDEFLGMTIKDIRPQDELPRLMDNIAHLSAGLDHAGDWRHLKKDGSLIDVEITSHTLAFEGRKAELVIANDVTARKAAEKALEKSELRYRAIVESTTDLICRFLPDTTLTFVNEAYCRYFDRTRDQLVGTPFLSLIPESDWEGVKFHVNQVFQNRQPVTYSHEAITPQGGIRWQQWTDSTILNKDGEVVELQSVGRDVTELKHIEEALKDSQRRLSAAMHATRIGVWEWDMRTNKAYWSDENYRVLGLEPGSTEAKYENWAKCVHPDDLSVAEAKVSEAMSNRSDLNIEFRVMWPDGSIHWINDIGSLLLDEKGEPLGMYGIQMDVTERKRAEEEREKLIGELEAKNAELERFTYTVSHDLKSPVVTIKGFLGFLKQDVAEANMERFNSDLERISNAAQKMEQLLRDLLELSRIGRLMNPPKQAPFDSLVREALELVHGRLEAGGVAVYIQPNLPVVFGDHQRLVEVLQNLIDNAAKYMGDQPNPHIEIGQRGEENGRLVFYIKDNGMGIAPEHHDRVFGLFSKLDARSEGTGVGLALVKRIIEFHGGRIWVQGEAGKGSTFLFTLSPAGTPPAGPSS